jgi:hypothetical protein
LLSRNIGRRNTYSQSFTPQSPSDYPPSASVSESVSRQRKEQTLSTSGQTSNIPSKEKVNFFDDRQIEYTEQEQEITPNFFAEEKPPTSPSNISNSSFPQPDTQKANKVFEPDTTSDTNVSFPKQKKSSVEDIPSPAWLKSREASLYSYQPKEKTEIKTTPDKVKSEPNIPKNSFPAKNADGIYDASYRVISPSQDQVNQDEVYWDDEDEDWDF